MGDAPCPFCGGTDINFLHNRLDGSGTMSCGDCNATGPTVTKYDFIRLRKTDVPFDKVYEEIVRTARLRWNNR